MLDALKADGIPVSLDSYQPATQAYALSRGVAYLNDIRGFPDAAFYPQLAKSSAKLVVMHSVQDGQADRREAPAGDIMDHIAAFFETRPHRTHFAGGVVADGDDEVHLRCVGRGVLVPALAAQILGRVIHRLHLFDGEGIDLAGWVTAGAVGAEAPLPHRVDESFGHDAARRIAGAEDEDVIDSFGHDVSLSGSGWGAMAMDERSVASSMTWPAAFRSE